MCSRARAARLTAAACVRIALLTASLTPSVAPAAHSQEAATPTSTDALERIVAHTLDRSDLGELAASLIDTVGGRLSGTPNGERAEAWALRRLGGLGFDSVWLERVEFPVWTHRGTEVRVVEPADLANREIAALALGYSAARSADPVPVLDIGRGDPRALSTQGASARGAALLTDAITPALIEAAARAGAVALLQITSEPGRLPRARAAPVAAPPVGIALISLSFEDGLWLRRVAAGGPVRVRVRVDAETAPGVAHNVVAEWHGADPLVRDEAVIVGAHLDAWDTGDGAIDNGTGVLTAVIAASVFPLEGLRARRSVRLVLFAAEELGLIGSREYVRAHRASLGSVVAMMNLDMVGEPAGYGATGHSEADTLFARLVRSAPLRPLELAGSVDHGGGAGSDHQPFLLAGVPTLYVRTSLPPESLRWYHNAGDTLDKVELGSIGRSAAAAAAALWEIADHPHRPLRHLDAEQTRRLVEKLGW